MSEIDRPTALIVDDDPSVRSLLVDLIGVCRPEVVVVGTACNGAEAVERARDLQPDIVFIDVRMPVMDGIQASRRIVDEGGRAEIIMFSSYDWSELRKEGFAAGARRFLKKPFEIELLGRAIDEAVAAVRARNHRALQRRTGAGGG